jgi:hypothetical protein
MPSAWANAGEHAQPLPTRPSCLTGQDFHGEASLHRGARATNFRPVRRLAHRGSRHAARLGHLHLRHSMREAFGQRLQPARHRNIARSARSHASAAPSPADHLLVEQQERDARAGPSYMTRRQRRAAPGQRRVGHEIAVQVERLLARFRSAIAGPSGPAASSARCRAGWRASPDPAPDRAPCGCGSAPAPRPAGRSCGSSVGRAEIHPRVVIGQRAPFAKAQMRLCSRKRPMIDLTVIRSDMPGTPGPQAADAAHARADLHPGIAGRIEPVDQAPDRSARSSWPRSRRLARRGHWRSRRSMHVALSLSRAGQRRNGQQFGAARLDIAGDEVEHAAASRPRRGSAVKKLRSV